VPLDWPTIEASAQKTGRVVIVHEAPRTGGFGGEVAAEIGERAFAWLDAPVVRLAYPDLPVPYARGLEAELLPTAERIVAAAREVLAF
jgi:pyruvate/2-oxoglutarate/acetoin dehydrogenase E1 component